MWQLPLDRLSPAVVRATICLDGSGLSFADVITAWRNDAAFRVFWNAALRDIPFDAWCFEMAPLTADTTQRPFECVFVDSPALARTAPEPAPFSEHFRSHPGCEVVVFKNLGGDALLVAPCPRAEPIVYTHLAAFARTAPAPQVDALWQRAAAALAERAGGAPVWFSTAGLGVYWLHLRLDARPKYYRYRPYADQRFRT